MLTMMYKLRSMKKIKRNSRTKTSMFQLLMITEKKKTRKTSLKLWNHQKEVEKESKVAKRVLPLAQNFFRRIISTRSTQPCNNLKWMKIMKTKRCKRKTRRSKSQLRNVEGLQDPRRALLNQLSVKQPLRNKLQPREEVAHQEAKRSNKSSKNKWARCQSNKLKRTTSTGLVKNSIRRWMTWMRNMRPLFKRLRPTRHLDNLLKKDFSNNQN